MWPAAHNQPSHFDEESDKLIYYFKHNSVVMDIKCQKRFLGFFNSKIKNFEKKVLPENFKIGFLLVTQITILI